MGLSQPIPREQVLALSRAPDVLPAVLLSRVWGFSRGLGAGLALETGISSVGSARGMSRAEVTERWHRG